MVGVCDTFACERAMGQERGKRLRVFTKIAIAALIPVLAMPAVAANDRLVKSKVPPIYPELAKRMKITGIVKIEAVVDATGKVTSVKTISGSSALQNAAEEAVRKWKFVSGEGNATVDVDVSFSMAE
jgi:TonB family protein